MSILLKRIEYVQEVWMLHDVQDKAEVSALSNKEMVRTMKYTIREVNGEVVTIDYEDGSWTQLHVHEGITPEELDHYAVLNSAVRPVYTAPDWITVGQEREAKLYEAEEPQIPKWYTDRQEAYGTTASQLEFIVEHGLDAWRDQVKEIKELFPKEV